MLLLELVRFFLTGDGELGVGVFFLTDLKGFSQLVKKFELELPRAYPDFERDPCFVFFAMSSSFDCNFDKLGFASSFDNDRCFLSRLLDTEGRFLGGDRLSLLRDCERSFRAGGDFLERLRSRLGGDLLLLFREVERSRRIGERLFLLLDTERSRRGGDDFLVRLLSLRGGDFRAFRSRERLRLSLDRLRLSLERLRLSFVFSVDRPRERRAGFVFSSFDFSFASFFI